MVGEKRMKEINVPAAGGRNERVDVLKGLAMLCIMMIHMRTEEFLGYSVLMSLYYAVPLYFLISGYLLADSVESNGFGRYLWKRTKRLLLPYLLFFGVSYLWVNTVQALSCGIRAFGFHVPWAQVARAFFFAGKYLNDLAVVPPPIWFLHALFFVSLVFYFLAKIKNTAVLVVLAVLLGVAVAPLQWALRESPLWLLRLFPAALVLMLCGCVIRRVQSKREKPRKQGRAFHSVFSLPLFWAALRLTRLGRGDTWEIGSGWYFLGALAFSLACFLIARESKNQMLAFVGRNSLYYLGIHPLLLILPMVEALPDHFADRGFDGAAAYFCYFAVCFLAVSVCVFAVVSAKARVLAVIREAARNR